MAALSTKSVDLPLFDISHETPELGEAIVKAAAEWGFLWIAASPTTEHSENNGTYDFGEDIVDNAFNISRRFFKEAPMAEKAACAITKDRGYIGMHVESLDPVHHKRGDFKQGFNLYAPNATTGAWTQPLPETFQKEDTALRDFHARCRAMAARILRLFALGLGIQDVDWLTRLHGQEESSVRFLYYPSLPPDSDYDQQADMGAGAHSDYGSITLLFTRPGQPGLEILAPDGKTWTGVSVFPEEYHSKTFPPVVVNVGDLLNYWTNGLLKSTVHRVVRRIPVQTQVNESQSEAEQSTNILNTDRFSIAAFIHPKANTVLVPIPSPQVQDRAASFKDKLIGHGGGVINADAMNTLTANGYLQARLRATYVK